MDSGFRAPRDRILYSLRSNGRYQLIVLGCGTFGLIYVFLQNGFEGTSVKPLVMALAYCWGLIHAIYLMGHGLVAVPRRLFRNASISGRLRRLQSCASRIHDELEDASLNVSDLEDQLSQLRQRKNGISNEHRQWVEEIMENVNQPVAHADSRLVSHVPVNSVPEVITDGYLANLTRRFDRARHRRLRFTNAWERLIQDAADSQSILDASASRRLGFEQMPATAANFGHGSILNPYLRYLLYFHITPGVRILLGALLALGSICIVWSELIKVAAPQLSIIGLTVVRHQDQEGGKVGFSGQIMASFWILYMCTAALASMDDVKVWGNRALVRRNTYGESACWYAGQIAKLTVPLAYNFITFLPPNIHRKTTFYEFLGHLIILTPLGKGFDYFFPAFILLPICATLFNLYGSTKKLFGYGIVDEDDNGNPSGYGTGGWREGRDLIERELHGRSSLGRSTPLDGRSSTLSGARSSVTGMGRHRSRLSAGMHISASNPTHLSDDFLRNESSLRQTRRSADNAQAATEDEEDGNVFPGFAHRFRNTIDKVERPTWLTSLSKRPKWMGTLSNISNNDRADTGRVWGRWFGGRPADGRLRI